MGDGLDIGAFQAADEVTPFGGCFISDRALAFHGDETSQTRPLAMIFKPGHIRRRPDAAGFDAAMVALGPFIGPANNRTYRTGYNVLKQMQAASPAARVRQFCKMIAQRRFSLNATSRPTMRARPLLLATCLDDEYSTGRGLRYCGAS